MSFRMNQLKFHNRISSQGLPTVCGFSQFCTVLGMLKIGLGQDRKQCVPYKPHPDKTMQVTTVKILSVLPYEQSFP